MALSNQAYLKKTLNNANKIAKVQNNRYRYNNNMSYIDMANLSNDISLRNILQSQGFNRNERIAAQRFNHNEAALARNWETEMSNTAHQREVMDLQKAGLNPVLAANSGAPVQSAPAATISGSSSGAAETDKTLISAMTGLAQTAMASNAQLASSSIAAEAAKYGYNIQEKLGHEKNAIDILNGFFNRRNAKDINSASNDTSSNNTWLTAMSGVIGALLIGAL